MPTCALEKEEAREITNRSYRGEYNILTFLRLCFTTTCSRYVCVTPIFHKIPGLSSLWYGISYSLKAGQNCFSTFFAGVTSSFCFILLEFPLSEQLNRLTAKRVELDKQREDLDKQREELDNQINQIKLKMAEKDSQQSQKITHHTDVELVKKN